MTTKTTQGIKKDPATYFNVKLGAYTVGALGRSPHLHDISMNPLPQDTRPVRYPGYHSLPRHPFIDHPKRDGKTAGWAVPRLNFDSEPGDL